MQPHNLPPNDFREEQIKGKELLAVYQYLHSVPATATEVSVALNIYRPNLCRRKRTLEKSGQLAVIKHIVCPITKHRASLLTTNPSLFPPRSEQLKLF